jgi:hypothetical protein
VSQQLRIQEYVHTENDNDTLNMASGATSSSSQNPKLKLESEDDGSDKDDGYGANMMRLNLGPATARTRTRTRPKLEWIHRAYEYEKPSRSVPPPNVCYTCQTIPFDELPGEREAALPHHLWRDLLRSTSLCQLCRVVVWAAQKVRDDLIAVVKQSEFPTEYLWAGNYRSGDVPGIDGETRVYLYGSYSYLEERELPYDSLLGLGVRLGPDRGPTSLLPEESNGVLRGADAIRGSSIRVLTIDSDPMAPLVHGKLRERATFIKTTARSIEQWLKKCDGDHKHCKSGESRLPDRVLEISHPDVLNQNVKLVETRKGEWEPSKYICLSYTWGTRGTVMTTSMTYKRLKKGVPAFVLPSTMWQAIQIAQRLGIDYVWIDSICVLQDDEDDWLEQTAKMADIYGNAYLTIAAAASTEAQDGLMVHRHPIYESPDAYGQGIRDTRLGAVAAAVVRLSNGDGSMLCFFPENIAPIPHRRKRRRRDPLRFNHQMSRAWALQERVLSPRVVHFAEDQLYWECSEGLESEDGLRSFPVRPSIGVDGHGGDWNESLGRLWQTLVEDYNRRLMANEADKLVAISGIVSTLADIVEDKYYAGIWESRLWSDLLWRVLPVTEWEALGYASAVLNDDSTETVGSDSETDDGVSRAMKDDPKKDPGFLLSQDWLRTVQPECPPYNKDPIIRHLESDPDFVWRETAALATYQAPSWSWASLTGIVKFVQPEHTILARCEEIKVVLKGSAESSSVGNLYNRFGQVDGGWLKLNVSFL